jgi:SWI/SNF chromatin-remodeling complex subunit SWI1
MQPQYPYGQHFTPSPGLTSGPPQPSLSAQHMQPPNLQQQQQKMYQMRLQHQQILQQNSIMSQTRQNPNPMANHAGQLMNPQMTGGLRPTQQQQQQQIPRQSNPEQFMKSLAQFMSQKGQNLNTAPIVGDRVINLMHLYVTVIKQGGSRKVTQAGLWPMIAASLGFPQLQYPNAPQEIKDHYEKYLALYEETWIQSQRMKQNVGPSSNMPQTSYPSSTAALQQQMPPTKQLNVQPQVQHHQMQHTPQSQVQQQTPSKHPIPPQNIDSRQPSLNGYMTPSQVQTKQQNSYGHRMGMGHSLDASPPQAMQSVVSTPSQSHKQGGPPLNDSTQPHFQNETSSPLKRASQIQSNFEPKVRVLDTHGGVDVSVLSLIGAELAHNKPNAPMFMELGVIDIHALTMSLQSGIHAEVRLALDTLATLSVEPRFQLQLESCEDLVETLVDCAEVQVEALAEYAPEVSDDMLIVPYEDVLRGCRSEVESLQDIPEFGSPDYELDRAVDRLVCITTILRNLSFYETNHALLADAIVVKFLSNVIRYLGTRNMLLRTNTNTLDFMKDIIIYLSNLSQAIELPGKEEALSLLHFLLAFAPSPPPTSSGNEMVMFAPYQPSIHRYLPPAVDSLAKLLARDEPNRTYYRAIFTADGASSPPFDLLTRTFGLAISPIPEHARGNLIQSVEARKPYLVQGMLAAEILANLAPGPEYGLARSWLSSEDGFALSLLRLVCLLSTQSNNVPQRHPTSGRMPPEDPQSYYPITHRGMAVLRRLAEKSKNPDDLSSQLPVGILPRKENLLGALLTSNIDSNVVRQLCAYAGLES